MREDRGVGLSVLDMERPRVALGGLQNGGGGR
jgi:hypothetical protein